jgi:hypothetical protein
MVVIDAEPLGVFQLADFADAPLPRQHALVVCRREAVDIARSVLAGLRTCSRCSGSVLYFSRCRASPLLEHERTKPGHCGIDVNDPKPTCTAVRETKTMEK